MVLKWFMHFCATPDLIHIICSELTHVYLCKCFYSYMWEVQWPNGWCTGLWNKQSGFEPQLGHCIVLLDKTLYSHSASLRPGV